MPRKRQTHSATLKAQVALAALKGDKTINELEVDPIVWTKNECFFATPCPAFLTRTLS
jgi:hypothetical protein